MGKLLDKLKEKLEGVKKGIDDKIRVYKNAPKDKFVPNVSGYRLDDLFVAQLIRVDNIIGEDDEYPDFDMETYSGVTPPPITLDDYETTIIDRFIVIRPCDDSKDETKDYYDICTGFGYNYLDSAAERGEECVDNIIPFQQFFKQVLLVSKTKTHPKVSRVDILRLKNFATKWIKDNNIEDLKEYDNFMQMIQAYY